MGRPHLVLLLASQLRYDVLGAYGDQQCPTPKLDLLAARSSIFERHFTPCPLTVPARSSLMTGLHTQRHGAIINGWLPAERAHGVVRAGTPLLVDRLTDAGYRVAHAGVLQVRTEPDLFARCPQVEFHGPYAPAEHHRQLQQRGLMLPDHAALRDPVIEHDAGRHLVFSGNAPRPAIFPLREDLFYDCAVAENIVNLVREHDAQKPLALLANFWLPHPPLWAPRNWATLIPPENVKLPATVGRWFGSTPVLQLANVPGQLGAHVTMDQWRLAWSVYLGMVALLDQCVGRVLAALDHAGMLDAAAVVFTSDHGEMLGSHKLYQKMCLYEESVRVPLLLKLPGQSSNRRVTDMTDHLDLAATLLELAGAEPLPGSPGRSIRPQAQGVTGREPRGTIFSAYDGCSGRGYAHRMVRTPMHKLIHNIGDQPELYDLIEDPRETQNLASRPEMRRVVAELVGALNRWMDEQGDPQPRIQ